MGITNLTEQPHFQIGNTTIVSTTKPEIEEADKYRSLTVLRVVPPALLGRGTGQVPGRTLPCGFTPRPHPHVPDGRTHDLQMSH